MLEKNNSVPELHQQLFRRGQGFAKTLQAKYHLVHRNWGYPSLVYLKFREKPQRIVKPIYPTYRLNIAYFVTRQIKKSVVLNRIVLLKTHFQITSYPTRLARTLPIFHKPINHLSVISFVPVSLKAAQRHQLGRPIEPTLVTKVFPGTVLPLKDWSPFESTTPPVQPYQTINKLSSITAFLKTLVPLVFLTTLLERTVQRSQPSQMISRRLQSAPTLILKRFLPAALKETTYRERLSQRVNQLLEPTSTTEVFPGTVLRSRNWSPSESATPPTQLHQAIRKSFLLERTVQRRQPNRIINQRLQNTPTLRLKRFLPAASLKEITYREKLSQPVNQLLEPTSTTEVFPGAILRSRNWSLSESVTPLTQPHQAISNSFSTTAFLKTLVPLVFLTTLLERAVQRRQPNQMISRRLQSAPTLILKRFLPAALKETTYRERLSQRVSQPLEPISITEVFPGTILRSRDWSPSESTTPPTQPHPAVSKSFLLERTVQRRQPNRIINQRLQNTPTLRLKRVLTPVLSKETTHREKLNQPVSQLGLTSMTEVFPETILRSKDWSPSESVTPLTQPHQAIRKSSSLATAFLKTLVPLVFLTTLLERAVQRNQPNRIINQRLQNTPTLRLKRVLTPVLSKETTHREKLNQPVSQLGLTSMTEVFPETILRSQDWSPSESTTPPTQPHPAVSKSFLLERTVQRRQSNRIIDQLLQSAPTLRLKRFLPAASLKETTYRERLSQRVSQPLGLTSMTEVFPVTILRSKDWSPFESTTPPVQPHRMTNRPFQITATFPKLPVLLRVLFERITQFERVVQRNQFSRMFSTQWQKKLVNINELQDRFAPTKLIKRQLMTHVILAKHPSAFKTARFSQEIPEGIASSQRIFRHEKIHPESRTNRDNINLYYRKLAPTDTQEVPLSKQIDQQLDQKMAELKKVLTNIPSPPPINRVADTVYQMIERKIEIEKERRGR